MGEHRPGPGDRANTLYAQRGTNQMCSVDSSQVLLALSTRLLYYTVISNFSVNP